MSNDAESVIQPFRRHAQDLSSATFRFAAIVDGRRWTVEVPLRSVQISFEKHARAVGCPLPRSLGARTQHRTIGGFFDSIKKAYKSVTRKVKHALPKVAQRAIHHVEKTAEKAAKYTWDAHMIARDIVKSDAFAAGLVGASFVVPALAPAAAAVVAARTMLKNIDAGKRAAQAIARGVQQTPAMLQAITRGQRAKADAQTLVTSAKTGSTVARQFMGAFRQLG